jgi:hypothetical protein
MYNGWEFCVHSVILCGESASHTYPPKTFKSIEYINDLDVINLTSSSSESDSEETSGSTTVAEELLHVQDSRDSIDRELDATEQLPPPEASMPAVAAAPPAQHRKKATTSAYIQVFPR